MPCREASSRRAAAHLRFTIYDLRFTICKIRRAELAKLQSKCVRDVMKQ